MNKSIISIIFLFLAGGLIGWFGYTRREKLPTGAQIVFVLSEIFILWRLWVLIKSASESTNYNVAVNQSQTSINQLAQQGVHPSYGQAQYTLLANTIQQAMEGCGAAYDETLKPAFEKMKNDADIYALIKAYGVRTVDKCDWLTGDFIGDLASTLAHKFSGLEDYFQDGSISKINAILKKNGLTFSF